MLDYSGYVRRIAGIISSVLALMFVLACSAFGMTIADAKLLPDEQPVSLAGKAIVYTSTDYLYIEEDARNCGIRVQKAGHGLTGGRIDVSGTIKTNTSHERFIAASSITPAGSGEVGPLAMSNRSFGEATGSSGLNSIGLLVKTWGRFHQIDSASFTLDDGSGPGISCLTQPGTFLHSGWQYAVVTGISSLYQIDSVGHPCILVKDIQVILPEEAVSTPGTPSGATSVSANTTITYSTSGATCTQGHPIEYSFNWGDGSSSPWSTSTSADHSWSQGGNKTVFVTARCQAHPSIQAASPNLSVSVSDESRLGEMVFIPAGSFMMGNNGSEGSSPPANELPQHEVYLSAYSIGKYEVTRGEYRRFIEADGYSSQSYWSEAGWNWRNSVGRTEPGFWAPVQNLGTGNFTQTDDHPVIGVTYHEAEAYCNWAGGHLPTEAQWEKAARWTGGVSRTYPWGNTWNVELSNNYYDTSAASGGYMKKRTSVVGSYPSGASPYGCLDMTGNVLEWCSDPYQANYYSQTPIGGWVDPQGAPPNDQRVLRGGGFMSNADQCRCSKRQVNIRVDAFNTFGFRVAQ